MVVVVLKDDYVGRIRGKICFTMCSAAIYILFLIPPNRHKNPNGPLPIGEEEKKFLRETCVISDSCTITTAGFK